MDNSKSRKSDAAATRKRRSSILKSQRAPRAPLSELEFHVATPQDSAKSRRVSFSRRTGVAEFEINDATTAWKSVYEEHNKSLETSGNESGARPRRVQHLGGRSAALFQDAEAELVAEDEPRAEAEPPSAEAELSLLTERRTADVFRLAVDVSRGPTDRLDLDFSAVAPLDDLDALRQDLDAERRNNMSEFDIEVDFNATHFTLRADDSDDMSITDSVHSPRVAAVEQSPPDWTADKENVVVNPYVAPPPADFAGDECDDILVFDGKKCKFQSNLSDESLKPNASQRKTIIYDTAGDLSVTRAVAERVVLDNSLGLGVGSKTVFFEDVADMTVTRTVPAQILPQKADLRLVCGDDERVLASNETRGQTIVYGNENADISVTQALPANIIAPIQIACDDSNIVPERPESRTEKQKTMYFDDLADISVTQTLPANIIQREPERNNERDVGVKQTAPFLGQRGSARTALLGDELARPHTDRRRTIVYDNDDGDISVTHALPVNILDKNEAKPISNTGRRTTIVYRNDDCDVSITGVVPAILVERDEKPAQSENARRRTIVYGNNDGNISMTGVVPANIVVNAVEAKLTQAAGTDRRRTIVYGNDDGNISMTGVVPANIMVDRKVTLAQTSTTDRMKTIVYGNEDDNVSMTGVVPANIIDEKSNKLELPTTTERRKTVVFGNDDGNLSVTGVVPTNIMVDEVIANPTIHTDRRKTVVFGNDDGNLSITGVVPTNAIVDEQIKSTEEMKTTERRKTIVYENDDGNISVTGVVPAHIIVDKGEIKLPESPSNERRKTIVYGNNEGEISMTGVVPANIMVDKDGTYENQPTNLERTRTVAYGNYDGDVSTTGVLAAEELEDGAKLAQSFNTERRRTVVGNEDGDVFMTEVVPVDNIVDDRVDQSQHTHSERRKTVVDGIDVGNITMKGVVPATDLLTEEKEDRANPTQPERRKTIVYGNDEGNLSMTGVVPANVTADIGGANHTQPILTERRKTIAYEDNEGNLSMTGVVPANVTADIGGANHTQPILTERRKTIAYEDNEGNLSMTGVVPAHVTADIGGANHTQRILTERRKTIAYEDNEGNLSMTGVVPAHVTADIGGANHTQLILTERRKTIAYEDNEGNLSMTGVVPAHVTADIGGANHTQPILTERRKTIACENNEGNLSMTGVVPANVTADIGGANHTQPILTERRKTIACENNEGNLSMTGVVPANVTADIGGANHTQPILTERRKTIACENNEGNLSMTGVVPANVTADIGGANHTQLILTERRKTIAYENNEGNLSMTGVVPANVTADIGGANHTQLILTERRKTIAYENNEGNLSMTGVVPAHVTADIGGANHTQPILTERRKTIVYENEDDISMTGVVPADIIEEANRATNTERRKTVGNENDEIIKENIDYGDERDVSMTEVETRSHSLCGALQTQPIEPEDIICEDKNDQVSMTAVPRSPTVESHDDVSMQTSAVSQSLANKLYGDLSLNKTNATFLKSPGKVLVYEAATRGGEIGHTQDDGSLSMYGSQEDDARDMSVDALLSLTSNRVSKIDVQSHKSDDFEAMCTATIDAFSRSLAAARSSPIDAHFENSMSDSVSMLDPLSRTDRPDTSVLELSRLAPDRMALDVLSRGLAPDRASILKELSRRSPSASVLDALLDMSSMDDELVVGPTQADHSCVLVNDSNDEADDKGTDRDEHTSVSTTRLEYEGNHGVGDRSRRVSERKDRSVYCEQFSKKEDTRVETEDVERDEGNQTQWPTSCVGTQADDTKAILDALDHITDTRRSGDFRRSLAPDRRSMLRSREDLLKDISMAQALMKIETERSDSSDEDEPSPPEVVKTLRFDDDSVRESPGVLRKPVSAESPPSRRAVIPPYLRDVGGIKDLMEELVKPMADASPVPAARHSAVQTDGLPSSQIDLAEAQYRATPSTHATPLGVGEPRPRTPSPLARLPSPPVLVFDRHNPLNNVALPRAAGAPHGYSPPREDVAAVPSACPSLEPRATQTDATPAPDTREHVVFAAHVVEHERSPGVAPMEEEEPVAQRSPARVAFALAAEEEEEEAEPEVRKRGYSPADPRYHELTPKPAIKVQRISTTPRARARSPSDVTVQQLLSEFHLSELAAPSMTRVRTASLHEAHSADDVRGDAGVDVINRISMLPFMGTECSWESRSGDTWTFRLLRSRLRLVVRLAHGVQRARATTAVVLAVVQHAHTHDSSDPVARWCVRLAAEALQQQALDVRSAGALPGALRAAVALCRRALRWARALHHARSQLACSLDDSGLLALKVANIPLRCVWEVTLRISLCAEGGAPGWPRATEVRVARVLAGWAPGARELHDLLAPLPRDWGHVPRTIWKIFKYLKHKRLEDDELLVGASRGR